MIGRLAAKSPGSFAWLFAHELRLAFRAAGRGAWKRVWPLLILALVPIGLGILLAFVVAALPDGPPRPIVLNIVSLALGGIALVMLPTATANVLRTFHDRADFDLLLAAPIPPGRVLAAKAVGLYAAVALPFLFLFGPFLIACAVLGRPGMLGGIAMILVDAVVATALAFAAARVLYRLIGPRGARTVMQVGAGLLGACVFLGFQAQNIAPETAHRLGRALVHAAAPPTPLDWPARATLGAPGPLAALLLFAAAGAWGATRVAARMIVAPASERSRTRTLAEGIPRFARGLTRIMVLKELRLLARDPELLAQVTLRLVFLIPVVALVFRAGGGAGGFDAPRLASATVLFAGFLAASLGWLTVCAEDAPELLAAAPVPEIELRRAKWLAAAMPPVLLALLPAALAVWLDAWSGAVALGVAALAAGSAAALQGWYGKPAPRKAFRQRQKQGFWLGLAETALAGAWSATALLTARLSLFALIPLLVAGAILYAAHAGREEAARKRAASGTLTIAPAAS